MRNSLTRQVASPLLGLPRGSFPVKIRIFSIRRQLCRRNYHTNSDIRYSNDQLRCKVVHNHGIRHSSAHPRILAFVKSLNSPFSSTAPSFAPSTNKPGLGSFSGSGSGFGNIADTPPTDFAALDVLGDLQGPAAGVEVITSDGFKLSNGIRIAGAGVMLIGGEAFKWRPWLAKGGDEDGDKNAGAKADMALLKNARGQWEVHESCWGLLDLVWPKPGNTFSLLNFPLIISWKKKVKWIGVEKLTQALQTFLY